MLNWCQNTLIITNNSNEKILKFFENNKNKEDTLDFNCLIELPEELEYNKILDEDKRKELKEKYNYNNPKDWCLNNWGTIWNAVDTVYAISTNEIIYSFETAWVPPIMWLNKLIEKYSDFNIRLEYEILDCDVGGIVNYNDNKIITDKYSLASHIWEKNKNIILKIIDYIVKNNMITTNSDVESLTKIIIETLSDDVKNIFHIYDWIKKEVKVIIKKYKKLHSKNIKLKYFDIGKKMKQLDLS